jgi:hypothetical protein
MAVILIIKITTPLTFASNKTSSQWHNCNFCLYSNILYLALQKFLQGPHPPFSIKSFPLINTSSVSEIFYSSGTVAL